MKISNVETFFLGKEVSTYGFAKGWITNRRVILVKITTDDGIVGWGEAFGYGANVGNKAIIDHIIKPAVIGRDPFDRGVLWEEIYDLLHCNNRGGCLTAALGGVDIALWDIMGKAVNLPICKLLGGIQRKKIKAYASALYIKPGKNLIEEQVKEAQSYVKEGYRAVKCKITCDERTDVPMVREIRNAIGSDIEFMIDANGAFDPAGAIHFARQIEKYDMYWFEEPVPPEDIQGYLMVREKTGIPLAGGESEYSRYGIRELVSRRAVDYLQPDITLAGGISEMMNMHTLASSYDVQLMPHFVGSVVSLAANLHVLATIPYNQNSLHPREPMIEHDRTETPFRDCLSDQTLVCENGFFQVPMGPGLGIEIDEEKVKKYIIS